jgi:hypothetical protein
MARELREGRDLRPAEEELPRRPATRGGCASVERPCPFVSCRHHLYLEVAPRTGSLKLNFPDVEPEEMVESCSLDVADRGAITLSRVADVMNVTRERVRQLEAKALEAALGREGFAEERAERAGGRRKRRLPVLGEGRSSP